MTLLWLGLALLTTVTFGCGELRSKSDLPSPTRLRKEKELASMAMEKEKQAAKNEVINNKRIDDLLQSEYLSLDPKVLSIGQLQSFIAKVSTDIKRNEGELWQLSKLNQVLCQKYLAMQTMCLNLRRIDGQTGSQVNCGVESKRDDIPIFYVSASGNFAAPVYFEFDATHISDSFTSGDRNLVVGPRPGTTAVTPRFVDLASLKLKSTTDERLSAEDIDVTLYVLGKPFLVLSDLEQDPTEKALRLIPEKLTLLQKDPACQMTQEDLKKIKDQYPLPEVKEVPVDKSAATKTELVEEAKEKVRALIEDRPSLEQARNRYGRLISELLQEQVVGCYGDMAIDRLELVIEGAHMPPKKLGESAVKETSTGNPSRFNVSLGPEIGFSFDETERSLFSTSGRYETTTFNYYKVKDIVHLRLTKGGVGFDADEVCTSQFKIIQDCTFLNFEEDRFQLDAIELRINGSTVYRAANLGFVFESGRLEFERMGIQSHSLFQKLLKRDDCVKF